MRRQKQIYAKYTLQYKNYDIWKTVLTMFACANKINQLKRIIYLLRTDRNVPPLCCFYEDQNENRIEPFFAYRAG